MTEGPETKLITEFLQSELENKIITDLQFIDGKYIQPEGYNEFKKYLPLLVECIECKGKFIYFILHNEHKKFYIMHSLRITGTWQEKKDNTVIGILK